MQIMDKSDKIFVAGYRGMVGSALMRRLEAEAFSNVVTRERAQLDLTDESAVAEQRHPLGIRQRCAQTALSWKLLHLSKVRAATDRGKRVAHWPVGADERSVRDRQDRRHQALPGIFLRI